MIRNRIAALLLLTTIQFVDSEVFYNLINREDPCISLCEKTPPFFSISEYVKSCCQRGCRFFNLVDLQYSLDPNVLNSLNGTRDVCEASCTEAYAEPQGLYACYMGCDFMATQKASDLLSLFSMAIYIEEGVDSNILVMSPDIPDNDILTDPGLRKEILPGWWDSSGFKLPQTYIKTVPLDARTADYGVASDYSGENEQSGSISGSDWIQCSSRHIGIPHWLLASAVVIGAMAAFWPCFSPEKANDLHRNLLVEKTSVPKRVGVYMLDNTPMYKELPPKYSDIINMSDVNMKV